jgi:hypothetical protein
MPGPDFAEDAMSVRTISVSNTHPQVQALSLGNVKAKLVTVTVTDSGADATATSLTPAMCGLSEIIYVGFSVDADDLGAVPGAGWQAQYDYASQLILFNGGAASTDELALADESLADVQVRCFVLGF